MQIKPKITLRNFKKLSHPFRSNTHFSKWVFPSTLLKEILFSESRYKENGETKESKKSPPLPSYPNSSYVKSLPVYPLEYCKHYSGHSQILTLDSASSCTTVLVVRSTRTVWSNLSSSRLFSISCQSILIMFPAAPYKKIIFLPTIKMFTYWCIMCTHVRIALS